MTRSRVPYADGGAVPVVDGAVRIDEPVAGFYRLRRQARSVPIAVRIWYGAPLDPVTGEELDRGWRWQATANGEPVDFDSVWPRCAGEPIDRAEHDHLTRLQEWGREHAPDSPQANPGQRVNLLTAPLTF